MGAVTQTDGAFLEVNDEQILAAIPTLAAKTGIFAEPAAAAAYAGLAKAVRTGEISTDERIVVISTGSGLKDVASAMKAVERRGIAPLRVAPDLGALKKIYQ
jgi:threonine synthase